MKPMPSPIKKQLKSRLKNSSAKINSSEVMSFFEARGQNYSDESPYISILYQDQNPDLVERRDAYEKSKIVPLLNLEPNDSVIDIGCGVGRWADSLKTKIKHYLGIDFSETLILRAKERVNYDNFKFETMPASEISPESIRSRNLFNVAIISGVLIYLNDDEVIDCLRGLSGLLDSNSKIYIREPLGTDGRFTLKSHWSEDLRAEYSAIYRTRNELTKLIKVALEPMTSEFKFRSLYDDPSMNNRAETCQYYTVIPFKEK